MRFVLLFFVLLTSLSCSTLKDLGADHYAKALLEAVPDIVSNVQKAGGVQEYTKDEMCKFYTHSGVLQAEDAWLNDWATFKPMFASPGTPESDETFCRSVITSLGATIATKTTEDTSATALPLVVSLPKDFPLRDPISRAALICHEAVHIKWETRVGAAIALVTYVHVSGRVGQEGVAYAISDAVERRHGWTEDQILQARNRRVKGFAKNYKVSKTLADACVGTFFTAVSTTFSQRSGY